MKKAILALENGSIYKGSSIGVDGERTGWVSCYTGVVGYQEVLTVPANASRIVVMTYPLIGNYGIAKRFMESIKPWIGGMVIKENSRIISNWQAEECLSTFLKRERVLAVEGIDTRALMVEIREAGEQFGIISTRDFNPVSLKRKIKTAGANALDVVKKISVKKINRISRGDLTVGIIDIGVTNSLLNQLETLGCQVVLIPYNTAYNDILNLSLQGLIISDGPEMDKGIYRVVDTVKRLLGKIPILGVATGCQVLAMAMGGRVERMHLGHHGLNYPVSRSRSLKGKITSQNHSYVINEDSLKDKSVKVSWRNINDRTIEGIESKKLRASGCQFYPSPSARGEVHSVLEEFVLTLQKNELKV